MPSLDLKFTALWYIAECKKCDIRMPFRDAATRDKWAGGHEKVRGPFDNELHTIHRMVEIWED